MHNPLIHEYLSPQNGTCHIVVPKVGVISLYFQLGTYHVVETVLLLESLFADTVRSMKMKVNELCSKLLHKCNAFSVDVVTYQIGE